MYYPGKINQLKMSDGPCGLRQYGELPLGYDHKYVYSHFGYNLKVTDLQAAVGCEQLKLTISQTKSLCLELLKITS